MITIEQVRREIDAEQEPLLAPSNAECFPRLREDETLTDYLCRGVLAIYDRSTAASTEVWSYKYIQCLNSFLYTISPTWTKLRLVTKYWIFSTDS